MKELINQILSDLGSEVESVLQEKDENKKLSVIKKCEKEIKKAQEGAYGYAFLTSHLIIVYARYYLGNLYSADPENRFELYQAVEQYRIAYKLSEELKDQYYPVFYEIRCNLANQLSHLGRKVEAIYFWSLSTPDSVDSPIVSRYAFAESLLYLANFINDPGHAKYYRYYAFLTYQDLRKLAFQNKIEHPQIFEDLTSDAFVNEMIKMQDYFKTPPDSLEDIVAQPLKNEKPAEYQRWCKNNKLYLNHLNDITTAWVVTKDIIQFPDHCVKKGNKGLYSALFSEIKRDYTTARHELFCALYDKEPKYESHNLCLADNEQHMDFSWAVQKQKQALITAFGVLDKIALLGSIYFLPEVKKNVSFNGRLIKRWDDPSLKEKDKIEQFKNHFIAALYHLAAEFLDPRVREKSKIFSPQYYKIKEMRNNLAHRFLRVSALKEGTKQDEHSILIGSDDLKQVVLDLLQITRAAIIYFVMAVKYHEDIVKKLKDSILHTKQTFLWGYNE